MTIFLEGQKEHRWRDSLFSILFELMYYFKKEEKKNFIEIAIGSS